MNPPRTETKPETRAETKPVQIRWMIRRHMADVLRIERSCFSYPWTEDDFLAELRQVNMIGNVAERDERIVGFVIYARHRSALELLNLAVLPSAWRSGVGAALVARLKDKLSLQRHRSIWLKVRERNVDCQLFLRAQGFAVVDVLRAHFEDPVEDAYRFAYQCARASAEPGPC